MPKTVDARVKALVSKLAINEPGKGAVTIHREVEQELGHAAVSVRTVGTLIKEVRALSNDQQSKYRDVRWPTSFGDTELPWEAAARLVEYTRVEGQAPDERLALWYWRASLALPGRDHEAWKAVAEKAAGFESIGAIERRELHDMVVSGVITQADKQQSLIGRQQQGEDVYRWVE